MRRRWSSVLTLPAGRVKNSIRRTRSPITPSTISMISETRETVLLYVRLYSAHYPMPRQREDVATVRGSLCENRMDEFAASSISRGQAELGVCTELQCSFSPRRPGFCRLVDEIPARSLILRLRMATYAADDRPHGIANIGRIIQTLRDNGDRETRRIFFLSITGRVGSADRSTEGSDCHGSDELTMTQGGCGERSPHAVSKYR